MAIHVAGVETYFGSQLAGSPLDAAGQRLARSATEGVVVGETFPYPPAEITPELVASCFDYAKGIWEPLIQAADPEIRKKEIKSALGPMISGDGAFARLGFHSAYHQGQAYLIKTSPGFPS
ncbi:MAG TPA: hypothetical protein VKT78_13645, partial [Fimbriimonadaceae bacterium]|nr:hypothetical protein [Fimbriimonadaceae bacterium]